MTLAHISRVLQSIVREADDDKWISLRGKLRLCLSFVTPPTGRSYRGHYPGWGNTVPAAVRQRPRDGGQPLFIIHEPRQGYGQESRDEAEML